MPQGEPKRQHTVPCGYLAGFGENPEGRETWLETFNLNSCQLKRLRTDYITIEKNFYTLYSDDGNPDYRIEHFFSNYVESGIADIVKKIESHTKLLDNDKIYLAEFIAFQEMRSKVRREWDGIQDGGFVKMCLHSIYEHLEDVDERIGSLQRTMIEQLGMKISNEEALKIMEQFDNGEKITIDNKKASIEAMLRLAPAIAKLILNRRWYFFEALGRFVTSDYPVYLHRHTSVPKFYGVGYGTAQYISFPVSKNIWLMAKERLSYKLEPEYIQIKDSKTIREMNLVSSQGADMWIIGSNGKIVNHVGKRIYNKNKEVRKRNSNSKIY